MRNNFDDIAFYFKKSDGFQITNSSDKYAIIVNTNTFQIVQIFRTSANYYQVIIASSIYCNRICENSFYSALRRVKKFFNDTTLHYRLW